MGPNNINLYPKYSQYVVFLLRAPYTDGIIMGMLREYARDLPSTSAQGISVNTATLSYYGVENEAYQHHNEHRHSIHTVLRLVPRGKACTTHLGVANRHILST